MTAINLIGDSDVSNVGGGAILPSTPGAPTNLVKNNSQITIDQVSFTWSAPEDDGGASILSYSVEMYDATAGKFVVDANVT